MPQTNPCNASALRLRILNHLALGVPEARRSLHRATGRFLADNGGWAVTRQDVMFPLAVLYRTPGTSCHRSRAVLDLALRGGDGLRKAQGPRGDWEFVKIDGSSWGRIYMPWSIYHWLEAYALLRDELDGRRLKQWEKGLTLACDGIARDTARPLSHNIPCWKGMSLVRAGQLFNRNDWREIGVRQERYAADHQRPGGFWPEGDGPTTHYNLVYLHSLGLYHAFTGDAHVLPAIKQAVRFHAAFTYPDGSAVETVDGRVKYTPEPNVTGLPGLMVTPAGRALASLIVRAVTRESDEHQRGRGDTSWRKNQATLSPHLASACQHLRDGETEELPQQADRARVVHGSAVVARSRPWFACVSGYVPTAQPRHRIARDRWIMTRTNCFSLFHDRLGVIIGGGNSKHDPYFATFAVTADQALRIEPDRVTFARRGGTETARFVYGGHVCLLHLTPRSSKEFEIAFELPALTAKRCQVTAGFTMRVPAGTSVRWKSRGPQPADTSTTLDPMRSIQFYWTPDHKHRQGTLACSDWTLHMPDNSGMSYPAYPFNPYAINDAAPPNEAVMSIYAHFDGARRRSFRLRLR